MVLSFCRYLYIQRVKKLRNDDSFINKKESTEYDPTYNYNYILKFIINNVNYWPKEAQLEYTIGETTVTMASPGESDSGVTFRIAGESNMPKGGQTFIICDAHIYSMEPTTTGMNFM